MNLSLTSSHPLRRIFGIAATTLAFSSAVALPTFLSATPVQAAPQNPVGLDKIKFRAETDKASYKKGETVQVELRARNTAKRAATVEFPSGQRFDFTLFREGEANSVYKWSADKIFVLQTSTVQIKAEGVERFTAEVPNLPTGRYRLEAYLTTNPNVQADPISFKIEEKSGGGKNNSDSPFDVNVTTDKKQYKLGEPVKINFSLTNTSSLPATLNINSAAQYDIFIKDSAGNSLWNWMANKKFLKANQPITLPAGTSNAYSETWNQETLPGANVYARLQRGTYTVHVVFQSEPNLKAKPVTIKIG